jgi:hypothetical protein
MAGANGGFSNDDVLDGDLTQFLGQESLLANLTNSPFAVGEQNEETCE